MQINTAKEPWEVQEKHAQKKARKQNVARIKEDESQMWEIFTQTHIKWGCHCTFMSFLVLTYSDLVPQQYLW